MLILARRAGEVITIGDDVTITVLSILKSQVKLGVDAPRETKIMRQEVLDRDAQDGDRQP